jgi:hypothetical protein
MLACTGTCPVWRMLSVVALVALADSRAAAACRHDAKVVSVSAGAGASEPPPCPVNPPCISSRTEARPANGYDHLVHISNGCDAVAECSVSTDVSPAVKNVTIAPGTEQTVVTARRAPTPDFAATVACSLRC